jgi:hypothetical protein
VDDMDVEIEKV